MIHVFMLLSIVVDNTCNCTLTLEFSSLNLHLATVTSQAQSYLQDLKLPNQFSLEILNKQDFDRESTDRANYSCVPTDSGLLDLEILHLRCLFFLQFSGTNHSIGHYRRR
jgi:hypothetical protein